MAIDKYRELYNWSNTVLQNEHERFNRIDEKAARYLSVITLLIGVEGAFGKTIFQQLVPPVTFLQWSLLNVAVLSNLMLTASWFVAFWTLRIAELKHQPLTQEMIEFFNNQTEVNIYYHIAKANGDAWEENRRITDRKAKALFYAYWMIVGTVVSIILFISLLFIQTWSNVPGANGDQKMHRDSEIKSQDAEKPARSSVPTPAEKPHQAQQQAMLKPDSDLTAPEYAVLKNRNTRPKEQ
jgi:hypothetical protein